MARLQRTWTSLRTPISPPACMQSAALESGCGPHASQVGYVGGFLRNLERAVHGSAENDSLVLLL